MDYKKKSGTGKPDRLTEKKHFFNYQPIAAIAFAVLLLMLAALFG